MSMPRHHPQRSRRSSVRCVLGPLLERLEERHLLSATMTAVHSHMLSTGMPPTNVAMDPDYISPLNLAGEVADVQAVDFRFTVHAAVRWDNGQVVTGGFGEDGPAGASIWAQGAPAAAGAHGLVVAFWQTDKAGDIVNVRYLGGYVWVDQNSSEGVGIRGTAHQGLSAKIGNVAGTLPDALDGQQTPITVPDTDGGSTTYSARISWGDGTSSLGTLKKNASGGWEVWGSHVYASAGVYRIQYGIFTLDRPAADSLGLQVVLPLEILISLEVSTAAITV